VSIVATLTAFVVPLRLVLAPTQPSLGVGLDAALTAVFGVDFLLRLRWRRGEARGKVGHSWWTAVDVLAALPLGRLLGLPGAGVLRLLKMSYLFSTLRFLGRSTRLNPVITRLGGFLFWLGVSAHWLACGWILLGGPSTLGADRVYLGALYWSVSPPVPRRRHG